MTEKEVQPYTSEFYGQFQEGSRESARAIAPVVLKLMKCDSVVDVGCGVGTWLSVFEELGVSTVVGIDGDYVNRDALQISPDKFLPCDIGAGFNLDSEFDLAVSVEVAEHIPEEHIGSYFDSLVKLAPVLLFSAAIPFQDGYLHVNEHWPEYWVKQFEQRGFVAIDCLRSQIWQKPGVEWWYAQNIMLFVKQDQLQFYPLLKEFREKASEQALPLVHPGLFFHKENVINELRLENERLRSRIKRVTSPWYILSRLPDIARRKFSQLVRLPRT